jgi:predicted DNA-binding transcriptional regulator
MTCLPMKCAVELTEPEKKTLQQLSLKHPHEDFRTRGLGLLELGRGRRVHEIAVELDVSDKSVYNWVHAWNARLERQMPLWFAERT